MKIIIVGAGKVGTALTQQLSAGNKVTVIDENPQLIENIINIYDVMAVSEMVPATMCRRRRRWTRPSF